MPIPAIRIDYKVGNLHLARQMARSQRTLRRAADGFDKTFRRIAVAAATGAAAVAQAVRAPLRRFADFEEALQRAGARTGLGLRRFRAQYEAEIRRISIATGVEATRVAGAVDKAVSGGLAGAAAAATAEAAARAEAAGLGMADTLVSAATTIATTFRGQLDDAGDAVDLLVATLQRGDGAAEQFAPALKANAALAGTLGLELGDVGAALSTISNVAPSASQAGTQLRSFLQSFAADVNGIGSKLQAVADATDLRIDLPSVQARLRAGDLTGVVGDLKRALVPRELADLAARARQATGADREALVGELAAATRRQLERGTAAGTVFANIEALQGFLALAADYEGFLERSRANAEALGTATDRAFGDAAGTFAVRWAQVLARVDDALTRIGEHVAPALEPLLTWRPNGGLERLGAQLRVVADTLVRLALWANRHRETIALFAGALLLWRAAVAVGQVLLKLGRTILALGRWMTVAKLKAIAMWGAFAAGVVAVGAVLAAVYAARRGIVRSWDDVLDAGAALVDNLVARFDRLKVTFRSLGRALHVAIASGVRRMLDVVSSGLNTVVGWVNTWIDRINLLLVALGKDPVGRIEARFDLGENIDVQGARDKLAALSDEWADAERRIVESGDRMGASLSRVGAAIVDEVVGMVAGARDALSGLIPSFELPSLGAGSKSGASGDAGLAEGLAEGFGGAWWRGRGAGGAGFGAGGAGFGAGGAGFGGGAQTFAPEAPALNLARRFNDDVRRAFAQLDFSGLADRLRHSFRTALVDNFFDRIADDLPKLFGGAAGGGGFGGFLKGVLSFHDGGVVPGRPGAEVLALLEAGETVTPAGAGAAGTVVQNFSATYVGDVDDAVRRANARQQRANALAALQATREARL